MSLAGLARDGVVELVRGRLGLLADPPDVDADALAATIVAETGGNPQHVLDVLERATAGDAALHRLGRSTRRGPHRRGRDVPVQGPARVPVRGRRLFFGRDDDVAALVSRLAGQRLLAVVGASGSGKSSVVRAGVLPALRARRARGQRAVADRDDHARPAPARPSLRPRARARSARPTGALLERLESDPPGSRPR